MPLQYSWDNRILITIVIGKLHMKLEIKNAWKVHSTNKIKPRKLNGIFGGIILSCQNITLNCNVLIIYKS